MTKIFVFFPDLLNVFEVFLPQLLLYPNASDPLNGDAASLMMKDKKLYDQKVKGEQAYCLFWDTFSDNFRPKLKSGFSISMIPRCLESAIVILNMNLLNYF